MTVTKRKKAGGTGTGTIAGRRRGPAGRAGKAKRPAARRPADAQKYKEAYNRAYDAGYDQGFNDGYAKGLEDGALDAQT